MSYLRSVAVVLLVFSAVAVGGTAIATAYDDAPGEPANFYGSVVDEDGTDAASGTTIVGVVDGEVEGDITVDTAGEYGAAGAFGEKLSLDSAAGEEVSFHIEDASGPKAEESPVDLEAGTFEQHLTFPEGAFEYDPEPDPDPEPGPSPDPDPDPTEYVLELLGEQDIDHDHACTHGDYDDRTPLDAGNSPESAPVESDDHIIWSVTYEGSEGYVRFDTNDHRYDGPFVFYMADGSVEPTDADVLESGSVDDDEYCDTLDEYIEVETPDDGEIVLELTGGERVDRSPSLSPPGDSSEEGDLIGGIDIEPDEPVTGENVTLDASDSSSADGTIVEYEWDVDGEKLTGERVNTTFHRPGEKEIELTVENEQGDLNTTTKTITVEPNDKTVFEVTEIETPTEATADSRFDVTATVTNTGEEGGKVTVVHTFDHGERNEQTVDIPHNESKAVSFSATAPATAGEYEHRVSTVDDVKTVQTTVVPAEKTEPEEETLDDEADEDEPDDSTPGFQILPALGAVVLVLIYRLR